MTVLICTVCSCGSVSRGTSLKPRGRGGSCSLLDHVLGWSSLLNVTSNPWSLTISAFPHGPPTSVPEYCPLTRTQYSSWYLFSSACVHLCHRQHGNSPMPYAGHFLRTVKAAFREPAGPMGGWELLFSLFISPFFAIPEDFSPKSTRHLGEALMTLPHTVDPDPYPTFAVHL